MSPGSDPRPERADDDALRASPSDPLPVRKGKTWLSGLRFAALRDFSVAYKLVLFLIILALSLYARQWLNAIFVSFATTLVLTAELFNSAIERLCDYLTEEREEEIRAIKDTSAAAVAICLVGWLIVIVAQIVHLLRFALE